MASRETLSSGARDVAPRTGPALASAAGGAARAGARSESGSRGVDEASGRG